MNTKLTTFDTMTSDLRGNNGWALIKNLIVDKYKVTTRTYFKNASGSANNVIQYVIGKWYADDTISVFGWGKASGDETWLKFDIGTDSWSTPSGGNGNMAGSQLPIAFYFEDNFYGFTDTAVSKWIPGTSFNTSWHATGYLLGSSWTTVCEPVLIGDYAYFAFDNKVYELAPGGTSLSLKYTLPTETVITSLSPTGRLLSVMSYNLVRRNSIEFIYDVATAAIAAIESIDWSHGRVVCHEDVNGVMLAVQDNYTAAGGTNNNQIFLLKRRLGSNFSTDATVTVADGQTGIPFHYLGSTSYAYAGGILSKVYNGKLYCKIRYTTTLGESVSGLLAYDRDGSWAIDITNEYDANNRSALGFIQYDTMWLIAHSQTGTTSVETTLVPPFGSSSGSTYYDGVLQTRLIDHGDRSAVKSFVGASVSFEPLSSSSYVKLYYKILGDADWTLLSTVSTEDANRLSYVNSSHTVPNYKEIQFQILAKNATITSFKETSLPIKDEPYDTK